MRASPAERWSRCPSRLRKRRSSRWAGGACPARPAGVAARDRRADGAEPDGGPQRPSAQDGSAALLERCRVLPRHGQKMGRGLHDQHRAHSRRPQRRQPDLGRSRQHLLLDRSGATCGGRHPDAARPLRRSKGARRLRQIRARALRVRGVTGRQGLVATCFLSTPFGAEGAGYGCVERPAAHCLAEACGISFDMRSRRCPLPRKRRAMGRSSLAPIVAGAIMVVAPSVWSRNALPDGNGKDLVQTACTGCHDLGRITRSGYTPEGWRNVISMMTHVGTPLTSEQIPVVTDYLAKNFPERAKSAASVIPGNVVVSIQEWTVPTAGSRPHDPLAAADGSIWYNGPMANVLGRLDSQTGKFKEYALPTQTSGPHGLVADKDGNIWFTANFKAYIGKLDPQTGDVTEYSLPDPAARDPHTLSFDQKGTLWFTVQGANMVGRMSAETAEMKLVTMPTAHALPYGLVISSTGVPFLDEFGSNKIASIDPETMAVHEYVLPNAEARPRRIAITSDDAIWYSDYGRGYLGRLDPKTGAVAEWPSPGGTESRPYAITALDDGIWYSECGGTTD